MLCVGRNVTLVADNKRFYTDHGIHSDRTHLRNEERVVFISVADHGRLRSARLARGRDFARWTHWHLSPQPYGGLVCVN